MDKIIGNMYDSVALSDENNNGFVMHPCFRGNGVNVDVDLAACTSGRLDCQDAGMLPIASKPSYQSYVLPLVRNNASGHNMK